MSMLPIYKQDLSSSFIQKLGEFLEEGFSYDSRELWISRFRYWWDENPYLTDVIPVGWIIVNDENELVGFMGNIPCEFTNHNEALSAVAGTSWYVRENIRGTISSPIYLLFGRQNATLFINTTPSKSVQAGLPRLGFKRTQSSPVVCNYSSFIQLKKTAAFYSGVLSRAAGHESGLKKTLYRTLSVAGSVAKTVLPDAKKKDASQDSKSEYKFHECKTAAEFIAQYPKHKTENSIEIAKDETSLNWMFFSPAIQNLLHRKVVQLFSKDGEYLGYCVYDIKEGSDSRYMRITEMKFLKPEKSSVHALISYVKSVAKNEGCFQLTYRQLIPDDALNALLRKEFLLCRLTDGNYHIKFKKNFITDVDPYSIYAPSDLDPDVGFI